jgi:hypothetical protein
MLGLGAGHVNRGLSGAGDVSISAARRAKEPSSLSDRAGAGGARRRGGGRRESHADRSIDPPARPVINGDRAPATAGQSRYGLQATVFRGRVPEQLWPYRQSISVIREIMESRRYPITIEGLERAMRYLSK